MTVTPMGHGRPPWGDRRKMRMVNKLTYLGRRFPVLRPGCALLIAWRASYSEKRHVGFGEVLDCLKYNLTPQEYELYGFAGRSPPTAAGWAACKRRTFAGPIWIFWYGRFPIVPQAAP